MFDIWILILERDGGMDEATFGLAAETGRLVRERGGKGRITAVSLGDLPLADPATLGGVGVDRVLILRSPDGEPLNGERGARALYDCMVSESPACLLGVQSALAGDLFPRVAGLTDAVLVTRAVDFHMPPSGPARAVRPLANGYLFEEIELAADPPPLVSFLPSVLTDAAPDTDRQAAVIEMAPNLPETKTALVRVIAAEPEHLDLEEADVIVAGGRGVGPDEAFDVIHQLAGAIGGTVGATRPVIDWGTLPYERQIGQTGKTVSPSLIVNCGISGANEYTAGIEKSRKIVAIDQNPRARIFKFADLGVVGDVHELLPRVISRIEELTS